MNKNSKEIVQTEQVPNNEQKVQNKFVCPSTANANVVRSCIQEENLYTPNCIRTFTGIYMNVFEPTLDMICIEDIAHALSNQCRFGGHLPEFYSVAQHSLLCCGLAEEEYQLQALLHDASEAYLLDIPRPVKQGLSNYKEIENKLMLLIASKFGFQYPLDQQVKLIDEEMLKIEWHGLMLSRKPPFECWTPAYAKEMFLKTFDELQSAAA
jgi:hypothetical protein